MVAKAAFLRWYDRLNLGLCERVPAAVAVIGDLAHVNAPHQGARHQIWQHGRVIALVIRQQLRGDLCRPLVHLKVYLAPFTALATPMAADFPLALAIRLQPAGIYHPMNRLAARSRPAALAGQPAAGTPACSWALAGQVPIRSNTEFAKPSNCRNARQKVTFSVSNSAMQLAE